MGDYDDTIQDDDITISSTGPLGSRTLVCQGGKTLFEAGPDDDVEAMIRAHMEREGFWPNVWTISDHGNVELVTL
jgi:hypothetical protein